MLSGVRGALGCKARISLCMRPADALRNLKFRDLFGVHVARVCDRFYTAVRLDKCLGGLVIAARCVAIAFTLIAVGRCRRRRFCCLRIGGPCRCS